MKTLNAGLNFLLVRHDHDCPTIETQRHADCVCIPELEFTNEDGFHQSIGQARQQRRESKREAEKAIRRAQRGREAK